MYTYLILVYRFKRNTCIIFGTHLQTKAADIRVHNVINLEVDIWPLFHVVHVKKCSIFPLLLDVIHSISYYTVSLHHIPYILSSIISICICYILPNNSIYPHSFHTNMYYSWYFNSIHSSPIIICALLATNITSNNLYVLRLTISQQKSTAKSNKKDDCKLWITYRVCVTGGSCCVTDKSCVQV